MFAPLSKGICAPLCWCIVSWLLLAVTADAKAQNGQFTISPNPQRILILEARIKLPDHPWRLAWSPDNETIAVTQFNKGELRLVHLKGRSVGEPVLTHFAGSTPIAWSPRKDYFVAAQRGGIRLFSTENWREVGQIASPFNGCHFQTESPPAFTKDGAYLWVSCIQRRTHRRYTATIKIALPNLQIADQLQLDPPMPGKRVGALHDRVQLQGAKVGFSTIIASYAPNKPGYPETPSYTLRAFDLTNKIEISSPMDLGNFGWGGGFMVNTPIQALLAIEEKVAAVRGWSSGYQITTINLAAGNKLAAIASIKEKSYHGLRDIRIAANGTLVIGAVSQLRNDVGGIHVWDASTGSLVQHVSNDPVAWIELSNDERNLAAIVRDELVIYRVNSRMDR